MRGTTKVMLVLLFLIGMVASIAESAHPVMAVPGAKMGVSGIFCESLTDAKKSADVKNPVGNCYPAMYQVTLVKNVFTKKTCFGEYDIWALVTEDEQKPLYLISYKVETDCTGV